MTRYAKLENGLLIYPPKNIEGVCNYDLDVEQLLKDGYKELVETERPSGQTSIIFVEEEDKIIIQYNVIKTPEELQQEEFEKDFFNTSLGYIRREVNMKNGEVKSFLTDILPLLEVGALIISYNNDGIQNLGVEVTEQFIQECKQQVLKDFYGE